jgi:hypothetical protein
MKTHKNSERLGRLANQIYGDLCLEPKTRRSTSAGVFILFAMLASACIVTGCTGPERRITGKIYDNQSGSAVRGLRLALVRDPGNYDGNPIGLFGMPQPVVLRTSVTDYGGKFQFSLRSNRDLRICPIVYERTGPVNGAERWSAQIIDSNAGASTLYDQYSSYIPYIPVSAHLFGRY